MHKLVPAGRPTPTVIGIGLGLTVGLGLVAAGCSRDTAATTTSRAPVVTPVAPSVLSVSAGRFVDDVAVGGRTLLVSPPPRKAAPAFDLQDATASFDADRAFEGTYEFAVVGLGVATIDTTTTVPSATTTPGAPATTTTTPLLPVYDERLAWIGIAVAERATCSGGTPETVALVMDADTGSDAEQVTSGGCSASSPADAPTVSLPDRLVSVPWSPVGPASTAITAEIPRCDTYVGWTNVFEGAAALIQVQASGPYDCAVSGVRPLVVGLVVPLGTPADGGLHAPGGPVDNLDVLPSSVPATSASG